MEIYIYGLFDPETQKLMYIRKTKDPYKREYEHNNRKGKAPKDRWIEKLKAKGHWPIFQVIEEFDEDNWWVMERYLIKKYNHKRNRLLNQRTADSWGPEMDILVRNGSIYKKISKEEIFPVIQLENGEIWKICKNKSIKKPRYFIKKVDVFSGTSKRFHNEEVIIYSTPIDKLPKLPRSFKYPYLKLTALI